MRAWLVQQSLPFLLLPPLVAAHIKSCVGACELALSHVVFPDVNASLGYYPAQCGSKLRITSVYVCMRSYCRPGEIAAGWPELNQDCELYANITLPPFSTIGNVTDEDVAHFRQLGVDEFDVGLKLDEPALPTSPLFHLAYRTKDAWNNSVTTRHAYGNAMFYFWAVVVVIGLANRWLTASHPRFASDAIENSPKSATWLALKRLLQRYLTIPATLSHHCADPIGWCTVPPRMQSLALLMFAAINLILSCTTYEVFTGNLYWTPIVQWTRYIGDRTGILATANLPIIWLFATRNNLVLQVTGWSFDTAMQFHRWVARISTLEAVVHSLAYTLCVILGQSWQTYWQEWTLRYWSMGALATLVMCLLCALSLYPMRTHHYELFLTLHISLGILTLLGMYYHIEIFHGAYDWYLYPCLAVWLLDRAARIARLAYLNFPIRHSTISWNQTTNVVTLAVPCAVNRQPRPGEYYFLYLLHDKSFYESHPFTLSSWNVASLGGAKPSLNFLIRPYDGFTQRLADMARINKAGSGNSGGGFCKARVLLEGPYGPRHDLRSHDSLTFVVGGTGIAVALAYLTDLCATIADKGRLYRASHFRIVWAVRHRALFEHVYEHEIKPRLEEVMVDMAASAPFHLELDVYVTRADGAVSPDSFGAAYSRTIAGPTHEDTSEHSPLLSPASSPPPTRETSPPLPNLPSPPKSTSILHNNAHVTIHSIGHPPIPSIILSACRWTFSTNASLSDTASEDEDKSRHPSRRRREPRIAIVSCGPPSLADAVRTAVVEALGEHVGGVGDVDFYNESYSW
ncbi:uncharacterized protein HMPREF1541_07977 [Cyphellophora europaea CBS 101466]|uniref:FAD-binding FR-type domain-containing protein n=1 Tax=Cyphellophora europaea (strain CBS 101466) TaxID=1220924 RepID=W2RMP3_CYPE1|nr:uncharacterized protein HMPREF1541_07977 [Cyphellophora europaea CBS 101466]ETN36989.1 hypothetical protein HMPREF1541_07977 [Cyphellophora europaea CBS 101466]